MPCSQLSPMDQKTQFIADYLRRSFRLPTRVSIRHDYRVASTRRNMLGGKPWGDD